MLCRGYWKYRIRIAASAEFRKTFQLTEQYTVLTFSSVRNKFPNHWKTRWDAQHELSTSWSQQQSCYHSNKLKLSNDQKTVNSIQGLCNITLLLSVTPESVINLILTNLRLGENCTSLFISCNSFYKPSTRVNVRLCILYWFKQRIWFSGPRCFSSRDAAPRRTPSYHPLD